jgi:hypothetical protein
MGTVVQLFVFIILALVGTASGLHGQTVSTPSLKRLTVEDLMNVGVTSVLRRPKSLFQTASAVQVITQSDIRRSGAPSIPEALRLASNLEVAQIDARQWAISARGFNSNTEAQTAFVLEYQLKATFLFQFTQFVSWPDEAFAADAAPLIIGVVGEDPFGGYLDDVVRNESVDGHPLIVERFSRIEHIRDCHVLFVSKTEATHMEDVVAALKGRNVLTVGDSKDFADRGGMIQFVTQDNRTRLRINLEAAKASRLTISSKLLRPASVIRSGDD